MKALIVGDSCGALATVRELGRAGWTVGIGSSSRFGWAAISRYATHWHHVPPPASDLGEFIGAINRATEKHGYEVIFGAGDAEVLALSANREKIGPLFPCAPHPSWSVASTSWTWWKWQARRGLPRRSRWRPARAL